jgi:hypothetical protein
VRLSLHWIECIHGIGIHTVGGANGFTRWWCLLDDDEVCG